MGCFEVHDSGLRDGTRVRGRDRFIPAGEAPSPSRRQVASRLLRYATPLRVTASRRRGLLPIVFFWCAMRPKGPLRAPKEHGGKQPSARGAVKDRALLRATREVGECSAFAELPCPGECAAFVRIG